MIAGNLLDPSGGLIYHLRALVFGRHYWRTHKKNVAQFLNQWAPPKTSLLLVGCSAGYSLSREWLLSFESITAIEPDPLARLLFEKRFDLTSNFKFKWIKNRLQLDHDYPEAVVLFCNVLGQIEFNDEVKFSEALTRFCSKKQWASFHDVLSGKNYRWHPQGHSHEKRSLMELKLGITLEKGELELAAHAAYDFFKEVPNLQFDYWEWRITPSQTQIIEAIFKLPART